MKRTQKLPQIRLRILGFGLGLISILGVILALGRAGEPERYFVSALFMFCGGALWFLSLAFPKFSLRQTQYIFVLAILFLGLTLGLFYVFSFCGGECGCFQYRGYPGYWLKGSTCVTSYAAPIRMNAWEIDAPGLIADVVFWIDAGLIFSFLWKYIGSMPRLIENKA